MKCCMAIEHFITKCAFDISLKNHFFFIIQFFFFVTIQLIFSAIYGSHYNFWYYSWVPLHYFFKRTLSLEVYKLFKVNYFTLHSSVEQLLTNTIAVLSKQTGERQERKRCTSGVAEEWRYRLPARTLAAWLTGHGKRRKWDNTQ